VLACASLCQPVSAFGVPRQEFLSISKKKRGFQKKIFIPFFRNFPFSIHPLPSDLYHGDSRALIYKPFRPYARNLPIFFTDFSMNPTPKKLNEKK